MFCYKCYLKQKESTAQFLNHMKRRDPVSCVSECGGEQAGSMHGLPACLAEEEHLGNVDGLT